MTTKIFEIRDRATFIPALAIRLDDLSVSPLAINAHRYLLTRAGFGTTLERQERHVILVHLQTCAAHDDPYDWENRTMSTAHQHVLDKFEELPNGSVIDVEFILNETDKPKESELWTLEGE